MTAMIPREFLPDWMEESMKWKQEAGQRTTEDGTLPQRPICTQLLPDSLTKADWVRVGQR